MRAAMSISQLDEESGDSSFRVFNPESVRRAQSLCRERYSSLNWAREDDEGMSVNSDLIISADFGFTVSISLSIASLKRTICS